MPTGEQEYRNPLANWSDARLIAAEFERSVPPTGAIPAEMMRRLKEAVGAGAQASNTLGDQLRRLNVWLLVVTVAIGALTLAQVLVALKVIGR